MTSDEARHRALIAASLRRLGHDPGGLCEYHLLQGGISGSAVYRLQWPAEDLILKTTAPTSPPHVVARAWREALFFRHLAPHIPLRTPKLVAVHADEATGVDILLAAYRSPLAPTQWSAGDYAAMAEQLAGFHAAYWDRTSEMSSLDWLRRPDAGLTADGLAQAKRIWSELRGLERLRSIFTPQRSLVIVEAVGRIRTLLAAAPCLPLTLCHGDCHSDNLLRGPTDEFVWTDWQEVGLEQGPRDLAFCFQRAHFAGGTVPYADAQAAYQQRLEADAGRTIPLAAVRRASDTAELRGWLLDWPPYLAHGSPEQLERVVARVEVLLGELDGARGLDA
jgi:hypothetical protein